MKKNCVVFGNCQTVPIRNYLMSSATFRSLFNMIEIPAVHQMNPNMGIDDRILRNCDLFIYQHVTGSAYEPYLVRDYIMSRLPDRCLCFSFSNCYFAGLYPQYAKLDNIFPYADKYIMQFVNQGLRKEDIIEIVSDENFLSKHAVESHLHTTMMELIRRETQVDAKIANFLIAHYPNTQLFYTINHPNYLVTHHVAQQLLSLLGISPAEIVLRPHEPEFKDFIQPIYPSVIKHLGLGFVKPDERAYTFRNHPVTFREYVYYLVDYLKAK